MTTPDIFDETTLARQIACARREVSMRKYVYPKRVANKLMDQQQADRELSTMEGIVKTLEALANRQGSFKLDL